MKPDEVAGWLPHFQNGVDGGCIPFCTRCKHIEQARSLIAAEREACAKIAESAVRLNLMSTVAIAAAIRARSKTPEPFEATLTMPR